MIRVSKLALMVAALSLSMAQAAAQDKVEFQLSWLPTGQFSAYFAGLGNGFYKAENIDLTILKGSGSGDAVRRVGGGAALFGDGDISVIMAGRAREKLGVKCVQSVYTQSPHSMFVLEGSGINTIKDLEGKTVGTTAGNSHQVYFPLLAKMAGMDASKVRFLTVDPAAMGALLLNGQIAAAPQFSTNYHYQNQQAEKLGKTIKVLPYADYGFKIYSICIHSREDVIASRPELVARFLRATKKSFDWMRDNPQGAAEQHKRFNPEADVAASLGEIKAVLSLVYNADGERIGFGKFDPERLAVTWKVVAESQNLDATIDPASFVDTRFVP